MEEAKDQGAKTNKRKRNSPQHWDEKTRHREEMQKQKISSSNKQCECGGTMENHKFLYSTADTALKIKCAGSIRMKEIEYACELMNEVDYENVRIAIEQQLIGGYESQYQKEHELKKAEEENPMDTGTKQVPNQVKDIHIDLIRYNLEKEKEKEEKARREKIRKERKKEEEKSERSESEKDKGKEKNPEKFETQKHAEAKEKEKKQKFMKLNLTNVSEKDKQEAGPSKSKEEASKTPKIQPEMKMDRELPRQRNTHKHGHMSEGFAALMEATHKLNYLESDIRREARNGQKNH
ncbi:hypothetical protein JTB14_006816 [Gonioctena quinquepunctata]|nr:hypothetical protein JTB14_006816 [Gonioctena quinquepunctata]